MHNITGLPAADGVDRCVKNKPCAAKGTTAPAHYRVLFKHQHTVSRPAQDASRSQSAHSRAYYNRIILCFHKDLFLS
jgi:hypothetical protein